MKAKAPNNTVEYPMTNDSSPLSLLVDAAGSQSSDERIRVENDKMPAQQSPGDCSKKESTCTRTANPEGKSETIEKQPPQMKVPVASAPGVNDKMSLHQQLSAYAAAAQQHVAALTRANDFRAAVAAAQLQKQAAQIQNQDMLFASAAALTQHQLGLTGLAEGIQNQKQQLEALQRQQQQLLLMSATAAAAAATPALRSQLTSSALAARQQIQDAQLPPGQTNQDTILNRAGLHRAPTGLTSSSSVAGSTSTGTVSTQRPAGSVIVPCRARGMPMDHNFKTAYFVIPENVEHGEELICSYYPCRNAGIKFRYCAHCKVPVAKRNFRKRHRHGNEAGASTGTKSHSGVDSESVSTSFTSSRLSSLDTSDDAKRKADASLIEKVQAAARASRPMEVDTGNQSLDRSVSTITGASNSSYSPKEKSDNSDSASDDAGRSSSTSSTDGNETDRSSPSNSDESNNPSIVSEDSEPQRMYPIPQRAGPAVDRAARWAALLERHPSSDDSNAMSAWLLEVLSVSDAQGSAPFQAQSSSENDEGMQRPSTPPSASKKRGHSSMTSGESSTSSSYKGSEAGSFAEWKDRKKHKRPKKVTQQQ